MADLLRGTVPCQRCGRPTEGRRDRYTGTLVGTCTWCSFWHSRHWEDTVLPIVGLVAAIAIVVVVANWLSPKTQAPKFRPAEYCKDLDDEDELPASYYEDCIGDSDDLYPPDEGY